MNAFEIFFVTTRKKKKKITYSIKKIFLLVSKDSRSLDIYYRLLIFMLKNQDSCMIWSKKLMFDNNPAVDSLGVLFFFLPDRLTFGIMIFALSLLTNISYLSFLTLDFKIIEIKFSTIVYFLIEKCFSSR